MKLKESGIIFEFIDANTVVKFDDTKFYRDYFNKLYGAKGIDFIADYQQYLVFIEVKNCIGFESDNNWRTEINNIKVNTSSTSVNIEDRDSLDIEVSKKVAMTLACLVGANTKTNSCEASNELLVYLKEIVNSKVSKNEKQCVVLLFLEGDFRTKTRTKKMIMKRIQDSINTKLKWLNCKTIVVDSNTCGCRFFRVTNEECS